MSLITTRYMMVCWLTMALLLLGGVLSVAQAGIVIIANKQVKAVSIKPEQAARLWLGQLHTLAGSKVVVIDQRADSEVYEYFYHRLTGKNREQLKTHWAKMMFTGKGFPPKQLKNSKEVLRWVQNTPNGLGYIDSGTTINAVKVLSVH